MRDLLCFSHLRWGFVFQRPNHLMMRAARQYRVFFVEEPRFDEHLELPIMAIARVADGPIVCTPWLPASLGDDEIEAAQRELLHGLMQDEDVEPAVLWFYSPMALGYSDELRAPLVVYDCMDELTAFDHAPPELAAREAELLARAHVVFTGGSSLYRAKRDRHADVHAFPSSVDAAHFGRARTAEREPDDQRELPHPRLGFFGVIDERMDLGLLAAIADAEPSWQLVMVGPVVKIDPEALPKRPNIHWIGQRSYDELPAYIAGWDVAIMPFACNRATEFISPTKTLEYLAAGRPVVSTPIADVVEPYGRENLVRIAASAPAFVAAVAAALAEDPAPRRARADAMLAQTSWDDTWSRMHACMRADQTVELASGTRTQEVASCTTI